MTLQIKHPFTSAKSDGADATQVQPSNWNATHTLQMTGPALVGRVAGTQGDASEITLGTGLALSGGVLSSSATSSTVSTSFTLTAADDGKVINCTTALTITIPAALSPRPNIAVIPPASGNVSIAVTGGAQINGATTTLTRARAGNPAGFVIQPYSESDGYGVSGS